MSDGVYRGKDCEAAGRPRLLREACMGFLLVIRIRMVSYNII